MVFEERIKLAVDDATAGMSERFDPPIWMAVLGDASRMRAVTSVAAGGSSTGVTAKTAAVGWRLSTDLSHDSAGTSEPR